MKIISGALWIDKQTQPAGASKTVSVVWGMVENWLASPFFDWLI